MRWSPDIVGQWMSRVPADHACRTITRADEMKRNGWDECGEMVKWNLWKGKREKPREKPTQTPFRPPRTHMEWLRRELGIPVVGGERLTACAMRPHRDLFLACSLDITPPPPHVISVSGVDWKMLCTRQTHALWKNWNLISVMKLISIEENYSKLWEIL